MVNAVGGFFVYPEIRASDSDSSDAEISFG